MTDFLSWWADHWPLVPVLVLYPMYAWFLFPYIEKLYTKLRRREP